MGSDACKKCHAAEIDQWERTPHHLTIDTLHRKPEANAIARKTGTPSPWMAWIPVVNLVLMCRIAGRPGWWLLLLPLCCFLRCHLSFSCCLCFSSHDKHTHTHKM